MYKSRYQWIYVPRKSFCVHIGVDGHLLLLLTVHFYQYDVSSVFIKTCFNSFNFNKDAFTNLNNYCFKSYVRDVFV